MKLKNRIIEEESPLVATKSNRIVTDTDIAAELADREDFLRQYHREVAEQFFRADSDEESDGIPSQLSRKFIQDDVSALSDGSNDWNGDSLTQMEKLVIASRTVNSYLRMAISYCAISFSPSRSRRTGKIFPIL